MSRLDQFFEVLRSRNADKLVFQSGTAAWLSGPGNQRVTVMRRALTTGDIVSVIGELMPAAQQKTFLGLSAAEFDYESPSGVVHVVFTPEGEGVLAEVFPVGAKAAEPPPPAQEAAPVAESDGRPVLKVDAGPDLPADAMASLLTLCSKHRASDLHLTSNAPPAMRIDGDIVTLLGWGMPSAQRLTEMLWSITPQSNREQWLEAKDTDFAYETPESRFRANLFADRSGIAAVLRRVPGKVHSAEEMDIPKELLELCFLPKGLVLVTGPTGSGKSTTLAAMIDWINRHRDDNLITIEDPIEFVHQPKRCTIHQREIGVHTKGFKSALRAALREDPDVVLVGEMRDLETISIAIETAETGHLVFGTLHTNTAPSTVDRIIDQFPADRQSQVRTMLSESLKAVITQTLCKKIGGGRVAAREVLLVNSAVSNLIREGKTFQLASVMQTGRGMGMRTLNDALLELVRKGLIDAEEAMSKSLAKGELRKALDARKEANA